MARLRWCCSLFAVAYAVEGKFTGPNMNGKYALARTPKQREGHWSTDFKDYPGGVEYFEVYTGPVKSTYGEVFWTQLPEVTLPPDLVKRFDGKGMAVVGFEADQVRRTPAGDISVPINVAYNHHYGAALLGKGSSMQRLRRDPKDPRTVHKGCGSFGSEAGFVKVPVEHTPSTHGLPTSMIFGYANGGEFRKSYHGLAPPFAQVVESPNRISVEPMQIDTWNRDEMSLTGGPFVPGPVPKNARAPVTGPDAKYSGLLECPLTSRIRKHTAAGWNDSSAAQIFSCQKVKRCNRAPSTPEGCFSAARQLPGLSGVSLRTDQGNSSTLPASCTVSRSASGDAHVFFNSNDESQVCCGSGVDKIAGEQKSLVTLRLSLSAKHGADITMTGPDGVWFSVGFDADSMSNSPYAIVVEGDGQVTEHVLGVHRAGVQLNTSLQVLSNSVTAGMRTVVLQRPLQGLTPQHHTFDAHKMLLDFINAVGSGPKFSYHKSKTASSISLWPASAPACICSIPAVPFGHGGGTIEYLPTGESIGFTTSCNPTESIWTNHNPTCDLRTYQGGLQTCHHGWHLLDADQSVPWQDQPLEYWMKFRMYYQEYDPAHHVMATYGPDWTQWGIGANTAEYDVPQCPPGTPVEQCKHEITGVVTPVGTDLHIVAAHYHCHAPTCLAIEIWNKQTGELLCREAARYGNGTDLLPGGDRFDQENYIDQPPCLWGSPPLEPPPLVSGIPLLIKAVTNSTYSHLGEMALPQVLLASLPDSLFV
eukprot:TRINITY_DN72962_c0_g1_i1.p1 TRINITY_DN72962_c0_g1~~TRINITY_DN72962_c0_g1_i1.p1  ORF type:complete len:758 (+),score=77.23 TRINITY_DN72962_c0_g1_i1:72-2345(+)